MKNLSAIAFPLLMTGTMFITSFFMTNDPAVTISPAGTGLTETVLPLLIAMVKNAAILMLLISTGSSLNSIVKGSLAADVLCFLIYMFDNKLDLYPVHILFFQVIILSAMPVSRKYLFYLLKIPGAMRPKELIQLEMPGYDLEIS